MIVKIKFSSATCTADTILLCLDRVPAQICFVRDALRRGDKGGFEIARLAMRQAIFAYVDALARAIAFSCIIKPFRQETIKF